MDGDNLIKKHTIVPLYGFETALSSDKDIGYGYFIAKLPDKILDNFLEFGRLWDNAGITSVVDSFEKNRFLTTFCIDHRYDGLESPLLSHPESESDKTVRRIAQAIQLIKPVMTSPEFIIQTQGDNYKVVNAIKTNERSFVPESNELVLQPFNEEDICKVTILWPRVKDIYFKEKDVFNRIKNALEFFRVGLSMLAYQLRFVLFVIALESIYSTSKAEVTFSLSQRVAWFLGNDSNERIDYFETVKKCYKIRSQIVHGTHVSNDLKIEIDSLMLKLEDIIRRSLSKILLDDKILEIFLVQNKLKDYLNNLTLNV